LNDNFSAVEMQAQATHRVTPSILDWIMTSIPLIYNSRSCMIKLLCPENKSLGEEIYGKCSETKAMASASLASPIATA